MFTHHHISHVRCQVSGVRCHLSPVTCHLSPVTCHLSPVTCHLSPVTCHLSPVTYHLSPATCWVSPVTCHNLKTESALLADSFKICCKLRSNRKLFQEYCVVLSATNKWGLLANWRQGQREGASRQWRGRTGPRQGGTDIDICCTTIDHTTANDNPYKGLLPWLSDPV